jgi:nicotinamidase-related amidase
VEELKPEPQDIVVDKSRYSGFHNTRLESVLRGLRSESLVVCGITTHFCVECTARDAHMRDYRVVIASDATDEVNEIWKRTALTSFARGFGWGIIALQRRRIYSSSLRTGVYVGRPRYRHCVRRKIRNPNRIAPPLACMPTTQAMP